MGPGWPFPGTGGQAWWLQQSILHAAGVVEHELRIRLRTLHEHLFSELRQRDLFRSVYWALPEHNRPKVEGSVFVDIGCGPWNPWAFSFLLLLLGARKCYAFDLEPVADPSRATRALADLAAALLLDPARIVDAFPVSVASIVAHVAGFDMTRITDGDAGAVDRGRLHYECRDVSNLPLGNGEADVLMSNAFFEHVADVDAVAHEMARVTKPGGLGIHGIDSTDHRRYEDARFGPLDYLKEEVPHAHYFLGVPDRPGTGHWMNRLRPIQFRQVFERHGFEVLDFIPWVQQELDEPARAQLVEPFRSMSMQALQVVSGQFLLRRR